MKSITSVVLAGILLTGVASVNAAVTPPSYNFTDLHVLQKFSTSTVTGIIKWSSTGYERGWKSLGFFICYGHRNLGYACRYSYTV
ncbi:hypothetical protein [Nitrosomonas sp.]|uniref:hypothetical protein n=1 Tax=Nitrosomonas sp. TaxID=42353 RepID=UPI00374C92FB